MGKYYSCLTMTLHEAKMVADVAAGKRTSLPFNLDAKPEDLEIDELGCARDRLARTRSNGGVRNSERAMQRLERRIKALETALQLREQQMDHAYPVFTQHD